MEPMQSIQHARNIIVGMTTGKLNPARNGMVSGMGLQCADSGRGLWVWRPLNGKNELMGC